MLADLGKRGEELCDLVGNSARSGAITCVVSVVFHRHVWHAPTDVKILPFLRLLKYEAWHVHLVITSGLQAHGLVH